MSSFKPPNDYSLEDFQDFLFEKLPDFMDYILERGLLGEDELLSIHDLAYDKLGELRELDEFFDLMTWNVLILGDPSNELLLSIYDAVIQTCIIEPFKKETFL